MNLLSRETWKMGVDEDASVFSIRMATQKKELSDLIKKHGQCFMVKFGEDDIRPMWEDSINPNKLREEIRGPDGMFWDCPLCQPYDAWYPGSMNKDRQYFCKIIKPGWYSGCLEEDGISAKCVCIAKDRKHKFKKEK